MEGKNQEKNITQNVGKRLPNLPPRPPQTLPKSNEISKETNIQNKAGENFHNKALKKDNLNSKKKNSKKMFLIFSICIVGILLLLSFGIWLGIYIKNGKTLQLPSEAELEIVQINDKTFLLFDEIEGANKYIFKISTENESVEIVSEKNIVDVSTYFNQTKNFSVSVCVQGKDERSKSKYSEELNFKSIVKLESPHIVYNETENKVFFENVENANYYSVYYIKNDVVNIFEIIDTNSNVNFDCNFENGDYYVFVVAKSNSDFFSSSEPSNIISIHANKNEIKPISAELKGTNLSITLPQVCDYVQIEIGNKIYNFKTEDKLKFQIDLSILKVEIAGGTTVYVSSVIDNIKSDAVLATII